MNCPSCYKPMIDMCYECGVFYDKPEYVVNDLQDYIPKYKRCYCRLDHFREIINQYQGKEGKDIPKHVIDKIKEEIEKQPMTIKQALRKLKLTKYVENSMYIDFVINNKPLPYIPKLIEEKLIRFFKMINRTFDMLYGNQNKSFMSYYYILYKLLEIMGQQELMKDIPLIKTKTRLKQHDKVWITICEELGWRYIKIV